MAAEGNNAQAEFFARYYDDMRGLADYEPPHQVGGQPVGADDYACTADYCGRVDEMMKAVERAGVKGMAHQGGGARRRHRRTRRRRSQKGGRRKTRSNAGRFAVNARIRIRLPRH